jgi:hypothetical protein
MPFIGIGVGIGRQRFASGGGGGFDADYQAVLDYATTQGYTLPSASQQIIQNQLVIDLKTAGIWSKLDTFGVFATDGDSDFALIDWIRLTDYTAVNSPTFTTDEGFQGDGTSSFIDTNFNPFTQGVNFQNDNASRGSWVRVPISGEYVDGNANGNNLNFGFRIGSSNFNYINQGSSSITPIAVYSTTPDLKSIHTNSTVVTTVIDGTTVTTHSRIAIARPNFNQHILRNNSSYGSHQISAYFMGAYLVNENTNFRNAINNYINSL